MLKPALEAAAELDRWFVGVEVVLVCGDLQRRRQHSATSPASVRVAITWHAMWYCKVRCSLCS